MSSKTDSELDDILFAVCHGLASDEVVSDLRRRVASDENVRREYLRYVSLIGQLRFQSVPLVPKVDRLLASSLAPIRRVLESKLAAHNLTLRQFEVLEFLSEDPSLSQTQLAYRMGVEPPTFAGLVNRMVRDGWLEKTIDADDRRRCSLTVTSTAKAIWSEASQSISELRRKLLAGMSPDDIAVLLRVCEQIAINVDGIVPASSETVVQRLESSDVQVASAASNDELGS